MKKRGALGILVTNFGYYGSENEKLLVTNTKGNKNNKITGEWVILF